MAYFFTSSRIASQRPGIAAAALGLAALLLAAAPAARAQTHAKPSSDQAPNPALQSAPNSTTTIPNTALPSQTNFLRQPMFPPLWNVYRPWNLGEIDLANPTSLETAAESGEVRLTLRRVIELALADNLTIADAGYNRLDAKADLLRAEGGGAARGVTGAAQATTLFSGAIGAGGGGGSSGGSGGAGGVTGGGGGLRVPGGNLDPQISIFYGVEHSRSPLASPVLFGTAVQELNQSYGNIAYSQAFTTGTTIGLSGFGGTQLQNSNALFFNPQVVSDVTFGIGQDILPDGLHSVINRAQVIIARNEGKVADAVFRQNVQKTVAQTAEQYWDLVRLQRERVIAEQGTTYADQLLADTRELVARGKESEDQLIAVEGQRTTLRQNEITAETDLRKGATRLKFSLARAWDAPLITSRFIAVDPLPLPSPGSEPSEEAVIRTALANRPEIEQDRYNLDTKALAVKVTRDKLLPSLWVGASYSASGLSGLQENCAVTQFPCPTASLLAPVPGGFDQAFTQSLHRVYPDYAVGFSLNVPLRDRIGHADQARAELDLAQAQVEMRNQENQLAQEVDSDLIDLDGATRKLREVTAAKDLARKTLDNARARFQMGASGVTVMTIIDAQNALLDLQKAEVEARAAYAKAQIELQLASGTILKNYNVQLASAEASAPSPRGPWTIPALPAGH